MLGDGIVSFGTAVVTLSRRNAKSSPKIVWSSRSGSSTRIDGGVNTMLPPGLWNSTASSDASFLTPPSW